MTGGSVASGAIASACARTRLVQAVALLGALGTGGCQLVGYDLIERIEDAGGVGSEPGDATPASDAGGGGRLDGSVLAARDATVSDGRPADANPAEGGALCAGEVNACGGCSALAASPGARCGQCGVGRYACDGAEVLVCSGASDAPIVSSTSRLIDDFEDGDSNLPSSTGLDGYWFAFSDQTVGTLDPPDGSRITPVPGGAAGTARAARIAGEGFESFGAGMILRINAAECAVDVSRRRGVTFWVKGKSNLTLSVATVQTLDTQVCNPCNDHYHRTMTLTNTWTSYTVLWSDLTQFGWGTPVRFDTTQVEYLQFAFDANASFELYLDEVSFL